MTLANRPDTTSHFRVVRTDGDARAGLLTTAHGTIRTPVFMPVGTKATVKATSMREMRDLGTQILLANTYHLSQRPGVELIDQHGGLHAFMHWPGPILTDSGGYQVFSLRDSLALDDDGATFASVYDGSSCRYTPESVVRAQAKLGSDIAMALDVCPPGDAAEDVVFDAVTRTTAWARRARAAHLTDRRSTSGWSHTGVPQLQFGIVQGGTFPHLREQSAREIVDIGFDGYAIGGLSVGEPGHLTMPALSVATRLLPVAQPRYYMGLGDPVGVLEAIARGVDMFDCVLPTRWGRTASAIVPRAEAINGRLNLRNAVHAESLEPLVEGCKCPTCSAGYSRAYLRHLTQQREILGLRLLTNHNLWTMLDIARRARVAIGTGNFAAFYAAERARWSATTYDTNEKNGSGS